MMTHAYNEFYLDDAMQNMGDMLDYALVDCGYVPDAFFSWFISSGITAKIENGNPKYITGMSGVELAREVVFLTTGSYPTKERVIKDFTGREYWAGWILAYYQWYSRLEFDHMTENGLSLSEVLSLYILHEADQSKFVDTANEIISRHKLEKPSKLTTIRKARDYTQCQLAEQSGVALRMIQLYEQRQNDINKAQAGTLLSLAKALGCEMRDLME
ncbi:MAG: helix-turn-helix transcriptional regulator [Acetivibrio sp.]